MRIIPIELKKGLVAESLDGKIQEFKKGQHSYCYIKNIDCGKLYVSIIYYKLEMYLAYIIQKNGKNIKGSKKYLTETELRMINWFVALEEKLNE